MATEPFVLERTENPHPKMLRGAIDARTRAEKTASEEDTAFWRGYLTAMADATGCDPEELERWMDRHR